ncbi:xaa-Pro aminopeptidase 3 [Scaptodrosophila lebanonensis]|uniref:Xaa-Pro aminopeptidase 3 n=1 Tax=Drosophila lebanonensis TaxID=7225 RepID=A0A6J2TRS6_DROLE|nr:xaa-Pro aminopeptidase 3 [Scaptodrosophila lebanonensis]
MFALKHLARSQLIRGLAKAKITTQTTRLMCKALPTATANAAAVEGRTNVQNDSAKALESYGLHGLGQPTNASHPHLIRPNELVPGVTLAEFQQRRAQLMQSIQAYARSFGDVFNGRAGKTHMLLVSGATKKYMSGKIPYVFRQSSDFYYLTGCLEPDAVLMLTIDESSNVESTLFLRPKDSHAEMWDGPRTGPDLAVRHFGVNEAYAVDEFEKNLAKRSISLRPHIWFDIMSSELTNVNEEVMKLCQTDRAQILPSHTFLQGMRLLKSPAEMQLMRRTCDIASQSFNEVMADTRPGQSEHHLFAAIDYKCRMRNASFLAYPPVVAAGKNATVIHYVNNTQLMQPKELVLMDAGCEYGGYTSDITRTWPVSGEFTDPQRTLYDMMAQLQKESIALVMQTGGETLDQLFETTCYKLGKYLQEIGLIAKDVTDYKELTRQGYKFCPHHVSHYLGMDVHDTPNVPRTTRLASGMVFTVEPGIYISEARKDVPAEFRGIGIRIEDDLLINEQGQVEVLTAVCAKERRTLENLFKDKRAEN